MNLKSFFFISTKSNFISWVIFIINGILFKFRLINLISSRVLIPVINIASAPNFLNDFALLIDSFNDPALRASVLANIKILLLSFAALTAVLILFSELLRSSSLIY